MKTIASRQNPDRRAPSATWPIDPDPTGGGCCSMARTWCARRSTPALRVRSWSSSPLACSMREAEEGDARAALERDGVDVDRPTGPGACRRQSRTHAVGHRRHRAAPPAMPAAILADSATRFVLVGVDVQDPGNVGALLRVGGSGRRHRRDRLPATSANPFSWKALRGSMGSALRLPIAQEPASTTCSMSCRRAAGVRTVAAVAARRQRPGRRRLAGPRGTARRRRRTGPQRRGRRAVRRARHDSDGTAGRIAERGGGGRDPPLRAHGGTRSHERT